jgi:hypothetical protein
VHVSVVSSDVELYVQLNYLAALPSPPLLPSLSPLHSRTSRQHFPGTASSPASQRSPQRSHAQHEGAAAAPFTSTSSPLRPTAEAYMPGGSAQAAQQAAADESVDDSRDGGAGVYAPRDAYLFLVGSCWLLSWSRSMHRWWPNRISCGSLWSSGTFIGHTRRALDRQGGVTGHCGCRGSGHVRRR